MNLPKGVFIESQSAASPRAYVSEDALSGTVERKQAYEVRVVFVAMTEEALDALLLALAVSP